MAKAQIEVITSVERRRRWSTAEKERLVAASLEPGASVTALAHQAGIHPAQLYKWRRQIPTTPVEGNTKGLVEAWPIFSWKRWLPNRSWEASMNPKITPAHVSRAAVVYVRQSTMAQVAGNLESQRRHYDLAKAAEAAGFASVTVIDDDLGRSGSGTMQRPGFERLVAMVCSGEVGAVYCPNRS